MTAPAYLNPYSIPGTNQLHWSGTSNASHICYWEGAAFGAFNKRINTPFTRKGAVSHGWRKNQSHGDRGRSWTS